MGSPPTRSGMGSLYANLLDTSSNSTPTSISRAPVVFKQPAGDTPQTDDASTKKQQINSAALRFQPTKRPQLATQKQKTKASIARPPIPSPAGPTSTPGVPQADKARQPVKSTLADWASTADDDDVNGYYASRPERPRGNRKKRKKNQEAPVVPQNWDDIYDPSRPNNYEEYKNSEEKIREIRDWKDRLYAHRMTRRRSSDLDSESDTKERPVNRQFAPPPAYSFAPPSNIDSGEAFVPPPPPPAEIPNDQTGEDAYARRLRMTQQLTAPNPARAEAQPFPPPPSAASVAQPPPASISRAPVRYNFPAAPSELPSSEAELQEVLEREENDADDNPPSEVADAPEAAAPRSLRPGQKGFAERLMSKYGWTKGSGLGASGSGIVNPLRVQVEKRKKKPDSEGGGFIGGPGGRGKIIGGKKKGGTDAEEEGIFGAMSDVIVLRGMVDGMDLDAELGDGGLMQEIGEECGEKYGRVERVFIYRDPSKAPLVFVKFTSPLSGLRAVNALEGRVFNGNVIKAMFHDSEKFESGQYS